MGTHVTFSFHRDDSIIPTFTGNSRKDACIVHDNTYSVVIEEGDFRVSFRWNVLPMSSDGISTLRRNTAYRITVPQARVGLRNSNLEGYYLVDFSGRLWLAANERILVQVFERTRGRAAYRLDTEVGMTLMEESPRTRRNLENKSKPVKILTRLERIRLSDENGEIPKEKPIPRADLINQNMAKYEAEESKKRSQIEKAESNGIDLDAILKDL